MVLTIVALATNAWTASFPARPAMAEAYEPAVDYTSLLNMKFFENGLLRLDDANLAFAPADSPNASVEVVDAKGQSLAKFDYFPNYVYTAKVFGRIRVQGPAEVQITEPGDYEIRYSVNGKPSTRFPFNVKVLSSGDPFDPAKKYRFDGPWRSLAYIVMRAYKNTAIPTLFFWSGMADLRSGTKKDQTIAKLFRDGRMIGHSRRSQGHIPNSHYTRFDHNFLVPHEDRRAHEAAPITREHLAVNGKYSVRIERQSDGVLLRAFAFNVVNGQIQQLPRSVPGYEPNEDLLVPRVPVYGSSTYEFEPAIWIQTAP